jgi:hypothetical protein
MEQKEYHIKIYSISRFIIPMIVLIPTLSILDVDYLPETENKIISTLRFIVILIVSFLVARRVGSAKVKVILSIEGVAHVWISRFILSWEKNINIPWSIVDSYVFHEDRTFDSFIINLNNKTRYKINKLNIFPINDDFKKLVRDFPKLSNEYRNIIPIDNQTIKIKQGESLYTSKSFKWVFYFLLALFLVLLLTKVFNPNSGSTWSSLAIIGSGLLFYGGMILEKKRNK